MPHPFRGEGGGLVDRSQRLNFTFDGVSYQGVAGDTLASALLANGVRVVGRSFKYHRPRGLMGAGSDEPNAMVQVRVDGDRHEPNLRATQVELFDGLEAKSQNAWPSLNRDIGRINDHASRFLPAGFYYKTFMYPASWWMRYEHFIRRAAGMGVAPGAADPDVYRQRYAHSDVLVIGAGPAGLGAALSAARTGARVMLIDDSPTLGGGLRAAGPVPTNGGVAIDGESGSEWIGRVVAELRSMSNVTVLPRTTAFGYYDDNMVCLCERVADHVFAPPDGTPRQRLWRVRAKQVVVAAGAFERPIVFPGNDRPGVMLAHATQRYAREFGVACGEQAVLFACHDSAYEAIGAMTEAGVRVAAVVDSRAAGPGAEAADAAARANASIHAGSVVCCTSGDPVLASVEVRGYDGGALRGSPTQIECDLLAVSGGWNPAVHMFSQSTGSIRWDDGLTSFVPGDAKQGTYAAGAANGLFGIGACIGDGLRAGADAVRATGVDTQAPATPEVAGGFASAPYAIEPLWHVPKVSPSAPKRFVDFQNDVTADDIGLAVRENYAHVEHLKRYTTLGMGTDQGRTSNVNGLAILAELTGRQIPEVGVTTFRPPYTPTTLGTLAGIETGQRVSAIRRTPLDAEHRAMGAVMINAGVWQRANYYPQHSTRGLESLADASAREVLAVRRGVGICDVTTLGKVEVSGADAVTFLERIYINRLRAVKPGRCRYGIMLREDGHVMDDGTVTLLRNGRWYLTTTTGHAAQAFRHMEFYAQTVWPELDVKLVDVTDQWAGIAVAGPKARALLEQVVAGVDVSAGALPYQSCAEASLGDMALRLLRVTFSGELGYEVHVPSRYAVSVWRRLLALGEPLGVVPYGLEAMGIMRIEKGHVTHNELNGTVLASDVGLGRMAKPEGDFVGRRALNRPGLAPDGRLLLVGLRTSSGEPIIAGSQLISDSDAAIVRGSVGQRARVDTLGHVTSASYSPSLGEHIALALLANGEAGAGEGLVAASPLDGAYVPVEVCSPVFVDPQGGRARA